MKNRYIKNGIFATILSTICLVATAQSTNRSSYFLEDMSMRHKLNPALMSEHGYIAIPLLGDINMSLTSNVGLNSFLYPTSSGNLTTLLSSSIPTQMVLENLKDMNSLEQTLNMSILSTGFYKFGGFNTVDLSIKQFANGSISKEFFSFAKGGYDTYNIDNTSINANAYFDLAFGHSRKITNKLTVGAKVKLLFGAAYSSINLNQLTVTTGEDEWRIAASGSADIAMMGIPATIDDGSIDFDTNNRSYGLSGFGLGIDLGASYKLTDNITVSAAITDIGYMGWSGVNKLGIVGGETIITSSSDVMDSENLSDEIEDKIDRVTDSVIDMFDFKEDEPQGNRALSLPTTFTAGGEYSILDHKISFGLLFTGRVGGGMQNLAELMGVANFRPVDMFSASLSGAVSNLGNRYGVLLNLAPSKALNLFLAANLSTCKMSTQYIPIGKLNTGVSLGISIPIGGDRN